jgi:hypothetical protein
MSRLHFDSDEGFRARRLPVRMTDPQVRALYENQENYFGARDQPTPEDFWSGVALCVGMAILILGAALLAWLGLP